MEHTIFNACIFLASIIFVTARITDFQQNMNEGDLILMNGAGPYEGNVLVYHQDSWGFICDDNWDMREARIVCRQLGFPGARKHTYGSHFKRQFTREIWMDDVKCSGNEPNITSCPFNGWHNHNCRQAEAAGVECIPKPTEPPQPAYAKPKIGDEYKPERINFAIELEGGKTDSEGFVKLNLKGRKGTICADRGWNLEAAMVVCREVGRGYAVSFGQKTGSRNVYGGDDLDVILGFVQCTGKETALKDCSYFQLRKTDVCDLGKIATVRCKQDLPDLIPSRDLLKKSARVEDTPFSYLECAMDENCLSSSAYNIVRTVRNYRGLRRRLLRFSTSVLNNGTADFIPNLDRDDYEWHNCHLHYHSMSVFSHYNIIDKYGSKVAEGHKASFCLEDSKCFDGYTPKFRCENRGQQGISPQCYDNYFHDIDCQWIDISDLQPGKYLFQVRINPDRLVPEMTFENNDVTCDFYYSGTYYISVQNCRYGRI